MHFYLIKYEQVKTANLLVDLPFFGAPVENRTPDTLIKSQVLYQLSYRGVPDILP